MKTEIINRLIRKLGRGGYKIDPNITRINIFYILTEKFIQLLRGLMIIPFIKAKGLVFVGKGVKLKHKNLINVGKTFFIGDYAEINGLSSKGVNVGNNVSIHRGTIIDCTGGIRSIGEGIDIGNNVGFSPNCYIQVRGMVSIGSNVIFGPNSSIFSESHNFKDHESYINEQGETRLGVIIEDGVWIGANAIILDGVRVGANSIIAANSVVNKNVEEFSIVGGVPAKHLKSRKYG